MKRYSLIIWLLPAGSDVEIYFNGKLAARVPECNQVREILDNLFMLDKCDRTEDPGVMYGFS